MARVCVCVYIYLPNAQKLIEWKVECARFTPIEMLITEFGVNIYAEYVIIQLNVVVVIMPVEV